MKKVILFCFILFLFSSCNNNKTSDVEKIKLGMSENEVKYILGEPKDTQIENGYKQLYFKYESDFYNHWFIVTIVKGRVYDFETY